MVDMIVLNQKVKIKWNGRNKKHYIDRGYSFTKMSDEFEVRVEDLTIGSRAQIDVICDYCNDIVVKSYSNLLREREENNIKKDCCKKCQPLKIRELYGTLDEVAYDDKEDVETELGYSKRFLTDEFWRYYEEFGVYPKLSDLVSNSNYPSVSGYNKHWGNWSNFLRELNIISDDGWYVDDEIILTEMYSNDKISIKEIENELIGKISWNEIIRKAKSMNLKRSNFYIKRSYGVGKTKEERIKIAIEGIKDLYNDLDRIPTVHDYEEYSKLNNLLRRRNIEIGLNKKFSDICFDLFKDRNKNVKTKDQLLNELTSLKEKLGRVPMAKELTTYGLSEKKAYMRKFGMTYQELIESLGWSVSTPRLNFRTEEELLEDYSHFYKTLKRLPLLDDINNNENMSSYSTYIKYFGSLKNIWDILEIDYVSQMYSLGSGFTCLDKNKDVCRSTQEMDITNLLIDSNIFYIKEKAYSDLIIFDNYNKWRMDWYLPDYNLCVEYFGLYNDNQLNRSTRLGKYSRKVKKKIDTCQNNNIKLVALYREDIEDNYKGVKEKLALYIKQTQEA